MAAQSGSADASCDRCGERPGTPYRFRYGKKLTTSSRPVAAGYEVTSTYAVAGIGGAVLCDVCLRRARIGAGITMVIGAPILGAVSVGVWIVAISFESGGLAKAGLVLLALTVTSLPLGILAFGLMTVFDKKATLGEKEAIGLRRQVMEGQGFDAFWTSEEFARLK